MSSIPDRREYITTEAQGCVPTTGSLNINESPLVIVCLTRLLYPKGGETLPQGKLVGQGQSPHRVSHELPNGQGYLACGQIPHRLPA